MTIYDARRLKSHLENNSCIICGKPFKPTYSSTFNDIDTDSIGYSQNGKNVTFFHEHCFANEQKAAK